MEFVFNVRDSIDKDTFYWAHINAYLSHLIVVFILPVSEAKDGEFHVSKQVVFVVFILDPIDEFDGIVSGVPLSIRRHHENSNILLSHGLLVENEVRECLDHTVGSLAMVCGYIE